MLLLNSFKITVRKQQWNIFMTGGHNMNYIRKVEKYWFKANNCLVSNAAVR